MKFEKFLKGCGTHGQILTRKNGDRWLVCEGVGMKVPNGVINLLGSGEVGEKTKKILEAIVKADVDEYAELSRATLPPDGKASDIKRVFALPDIFEDEYLEVAISNADFGLLEKSDVNLSIVDIEDETGRETNYLVILNHDMEVVGFITEA